MDLSILRKKVKVTQPHKDGDDDVLLFKLLAHQLRGTNLWWALGIMS